jgi:hypothetical protein
MGIEKQIHVSRETYSFLIIVISQLSCFVLTFPGEVRFRSGQALKRQ